MKLTTVLIDDEPLSIELIKTYLKNIPDIELIGSFYDPVPALKFIANRIPDLVFLDIEMPKINGLDLTRSLPVTTKVILITAYREYAAEAFSLNVLDYLVKPFTFPRFLQAISKLHLTTGKTNTEQDSLYFKVDKKILRIEVADILWIESYKDYIRVNTCHQSFVTYQNLVGIEEFLPKESFERVHKEYVINLNFISFLEGNEIDLNGRKIPIGKSYKKQLLDKIRMKKAYASKSKFF